MKRVGIGIVAYVETNEDGSGALHLSAVSADRSGLPAAILFADAPHDVTALNGLPIYRHGPSVLLSGIRIGTMMTATRIAFEEEPMRAALERYHRERRHA